MGCGYSEEEKPEISRAQAQSFFKLEGLPLTLTVTQTDKHSLQLRVVGLDCPDELRLLEGALQKRKMRMKSALLLRVGSCVDQTFDLTMKRRRMTPIKGYLGAKAPATDMEIFERSVEEACKETPQAETAFRSAKGLGTVFKVTLRCAQRGGERGSVVETIRRLKHRLLAASLTCEDDSTISDGFWICSDEGQTMSKHEVLEELKLGLFSQVQKMTSVQAQMKKSKSGKDIAGMGTTMSMDCGMQEHSSISKFSIGSDSYRYGRNEHSTASAYSTMSADIKDFMESMSAPEPVAELPIVLQWTQKKVEYPVRLASVGMTVDGFGKYVGMGLVQRSIQEMLGSKEEAHSKQFAPLVLEMRTFFVAEKKSRASGQLAHFQHMLHDAVVGSPEYSHFVTWLDIANRTWTIDKVFLNDILPAGNGYGAKAVAEHLLAPPELFFQASDSAQWLGSFMESVPDIEKLVVLDIVNWNTYMLMAVAGSTEEEASKKVGDVLDFALSAELHNSGLTKDQLSKAPVVEVFKRTALGKMCGSVLRHCNQHLQRQIKMSSAEVVFGQGDEEIFGQRRPRMAVIVSLTDTSATGSRGKTRLQTWGQTLAPATENVHLKHDFKTQASPLWGGLAPVREGSHPLDDGPTDPMINKSMLSLDGMGAFLEESWAGSALQDMIKNTEQSEKHHSSSNFYFAGVASAMTLLLHQMQVERGLSCRAAAAALETEGSQVAVERVRGQRGSTDQALKQLLDFLKIAPSLIEKGTIELRHKDVLDLQQQISIRIMVQRGLVDDAIANKIGDWMGRYLTICTSGENAYHVLIGKLLHGIVRAIQFASEGIQTESPQSAAERCAILLRVKEQVGQERALIAAKGKSRLNDAELSSAGKEMLDALKLGTDRLVQLVTTEELRWSAPQNKNSVVDTLGEMHELFEKEKQDPSYSIPSHKAIFWFEALTRWIDAAYDQIQEEIFNVTEELPEENVAQPAPDVALLAVPEPGVLDEGDEGIRQLITELQAGKFSNVIVMAGAGISVSANLPDFRSKGGLYDQLRQTTNITSPETIFTRDFLKSNPELFFDVMQKLRVDHVMPTLTHFFMRLLQDKGLLRRIYTQNIDSLERKAGIREDLLIECHGTTATSKCHECQQAYSKDHYFDWDRANGVPRCEKCNGLTRPDIVLFGEALPQEFQEKSREDFKTADLLIIMGTSLQVQPFASLPKLVKSNCAILVVNRVMPGSLSLHRQVRGLKTVLSGKKLRKEVILQGDCDTSIRWLSKEVGWTEAIDEVKAGNSRTLV